MGKLEEDMKKVGVELTDCRIDLQMMQGEVAEKEKKR